MEKRTEKGEQASMTQASKLPVAALPSSYVSTKDDYGKFVSRKLSDSTLVFPAGITAGDVGAGERSVCQRGQQAVPM